MRRTSIFALLTLVACGVVGKDDPGPVDTDATDTAGTGTGTGTGAPVGDIATITGTLRDTSGAPVGDVDIRFCRGEACRYDTTVADGSFGFEKVEADWHSFEAVPKEATGLATAFFPVQLDKDEVRTVDLVVPPLDPKVPLPAGSGEIELGSGLLLTVGANDIEPPLFVDPATHAAGVRVDPADWPTVEREGTVVAIWYLVPFDHHATNGGLPIRFDNAVLGLPAGASYQVWVGSYADSAWLDAGEVTESGGYLSGDAKLPMITTVALVEK